MTRQRGHTAVGAGIKLVGVDKLKRLSQNISNFFRRLNGVGGHVNGADRREGSGVWPLMRTILAQETDQAEVA